MSALHAIQKDRGCTVGPGCEGSACTCKRMVRLVLEGVRRWTPAQNLAVIAELSGPTDRDPQATAWDAIRAYRAAIDTALKEVG